MLISVHHDDGHQGRVWQGSQGSPPPTRLTTLECVRPHLIALLDGECLMGLNVERLKERHPFITTFLLAVPSRRSHAGAAMLPRSQHAIVPWRMQSCVYLLDKLMLKRWPATCSPRAFGFGSEVILFLLNSLYLLCLWCLVVFPPQSHSFFVSLNNTAITKDHL